MEKSCKVKRSKLFLILSVILLMTMTGVCFADMGNPGGILILIPFLLSFAVSVSIFWISLITGFILFVISWFKSERRVSRKEYLKDDLYVISLLVIGVITSAFIIGFVLICIALKRANKLYRERISESGLYVNAQDGRKRLYHLSGLLVCSFAMLAANRFIPVFMAELQNAVRELSQRMIFGNMKDFFFWHPGMKKLLYVNLICWAVYLVLNLVYLVLAKGKSVKFIIDGLSVYVYIFAAYCFDSYGGVWLLFTAVMLAIKVLAAHSKYKAEREPKEKSFGERMAEAEKTDLWIGKLQEEAEKGPTHREGEVGNAETREENE